jgi:hypothetical protein
MDKLVEDLITIEAKTLSRIRNIADVKRVIKVMKRIAIDSDGLRYEITRNTVNPFARGLSFYPSLDKALAYLDPDKALSLFETADIDDLAYKVSYFDFLTDKETPFYTHEELAEVIELFIAYLKANKSWLLAIGYPMKSFEKSPWLYSNLSRLYPVKIPFTVQGRNPSHQKIAEVDGIAERDSEGNLIFNYTWIKEWFYDLEPLGALNNCSYEEAVLINGLQDKDIQYIEENRAKIFNLKIEILELTYKYLYQDMNANDYWENCMNTIANKLTKDANQQFKKIESAYSQLFVIDNKTTFFFTCLSAITGGQPNLDTGGISNILAFIFFVEAELTIGQMHKTKSRLLQLSKGIIPGSYYDLVFSPSILAIDEAITQSLNDAKKTMEFNDFFDERLRTDSEKKLKMILEVPSEKYDTLKGIRDLIEYGHVSFNLENIPFTSLSSRKKITPIALPSGVQWEDITIEFSDRHNVKIKYKNKTFRRDYKDMGFEDSKARKPNKQWEFLYLLAENKGEISWEKSSFGKMANIRKIEQDFGYEFDKDTSQNKGFSIIKVPDKTKKTKELLSKALKAVFSIEGDPFFPYKEVEAYKIRLKLIP